MSAKEKFTTENYHNSTEVTVYIRDVNDNSPQFKRNSFQVYVKEEQQPKVFIVQVYIIQGYFLTKTFRRD